MNNFFCAEESCEVKEDPIGCALNRRYYVLLEFPPPWTSDPLDKKALSGKLKGLKAVINEEVELFLRLVFIYNPNYHETGYNRLIIYYHQEEIFSNYVKKEFLLTDINDAVPIIEKCIKGETLESSDNNIQTRDILVCTHGSHDKCCAKYGNPFFRQALATVEDLSLSDVRVWQSSHFGGHRFAPTMIDLPEARYYGRLEPKSFAAILTRTGDIECFKNVYRGWGVLPWQVQFLERELMLNYGWKWFNYQVQGWVIKHNEDETFNQVEICFKTPDCMTNTYRCNVIEDKTKTIYTKGECCNSKLTKIPQFKITNLLKI
ncbi:sucrase ferredoxin [Plectonema cf. radiosum LEGE 06105]|uniref:Sucrase ferredoxin n=1 Tax=Plectonema cf. radiosum LEGE 06105 TaxID=945769 RepID=A0A8J7JUN4_9CYAN|nr:sucrase ferredoxin [Plectonema radiosum]MBE9213610.1 sucrase ferredoxin [Plectonema cf. radiosum LEGE 06105]